MSNCRQRCYQTREHFGEGLNCPGDNCDTGSTDKFEVLEKSQERVMFRFPAGTTYAALLFKDMGHTYARTALGTNNRKYGRIGGGHWGECVSPRENSDGQYCAQKKTNGVNVCQGTPASWNCEGSWNRWAEYYPLTETQVQISTSGVIEWTWGTDENKTYECCHKTWGGPTHRSYKTWRDLYGTKYGMVYPWKRDADGKIIEPRVERDATKPKEEIENLHQ